jgi:hypothetical protein
VGLLAVSVAAASITACGSGSAGAPGAPGAAGANGEAGAPGKMGLPGTPGLTGKMGQMGLPGRGDDAGPNISGITPPYAFQSRTVDLTISGSGTTWGTATTVAFANPDVKVNTVTVASEAALLVNVTISATATLGPTDVTVTDGAAVSKFVGAFQIEAPLTVLVSPDGGVPQGGYGNLHVEMNDLTTPFDPDTFQVVLSSPDLAVGQPSPTDYAFDLEVLADVLATPGQSNITVTSGEPTTVSSPGGGLVTIAPRVPTLLSTTSSATGSIQTALSTELYEFTPDLPPGAGEVQFVQFTVSSVAGVLNGTVIPQSGKYSDPATAYFLVRNGQATSTIDPLYVVVSDSDNPLSGPGPVPADSTVVTFQAAAFSATEETETPAANDDTYQTADVVSTLPALVSGTLGYGGVMPVDDQDFYAIGAVPVGKSIHAATGGDPNDATLITIRDSTGKQVAVSAGDDAQQDVVFQVTKADTYFVEVTPDTGAYAAAQFDTTGVADYMDPNYNTYQLFVALE